MTAPAHLEVVVRANSDGRTSQPTASVAPLVQQRHWVWQRQTQHVDTPEPVPAYLLRVLLYLDLVGRGGQQVPKHRLRRYIDAELPESLGVFSSISSLAAAMNMASGYGVVSGSRAIEYLEDVGWAREDDDLYELTSLGQAIVRAHADPGEIEDLGAVILSPDDPLKYQLLTRAFAAVGAGLLVDPYFKPGHLDWLASSTTVERVLVGSSGSQPRSNRELPFVLGRLGAGMRGTVEIRVTEDPSLHDRVVVHEDRAVSMLGSSLTGIGQHLTAIVPLPPEAALAYREHVERLWADAAVVEPRDGIVDEADTSGASGPVVGG